jgi:hypothetical protein
LEIDRLEDQDRLEIDRLERELDSALSLLVDWQDRCDRLTAERDTAREWAVRCENDERRSGAEKDDAIRLLIARLADSEAEVGALTVRNQELELLLASRPAS